MKKFKLGQNMDASRIALGCMRIPEEAGKAVEWLETAFEVGINYFDHADIYDGGGCERKFARALAQTQVKREDIYIQSKCGIRPGYFDFSKSHILNSVDGILERLGTEYLDVLLLHRPDTLMEPEEVAEAFSILHKSGKVREFGVSNQNPMQMELLQKYVEQKLIINQIQFGPAHSGIINCGMTVNMNIDNAINRDGSVLEYCRLHDITLQPWSPFMYGFFEGVFMGDGKYAELNKVLSRLANEKGVPEAAVAMAWILRHPAKMQPIAGTSNKEHLKDVAQANSVELSREEWYEIYRSAGNIVP